jgi:hypothetical protein
MKKRDTIKKILNIGILSLLFILGSGLGEVVWGQGEVWTYDFGTGTGTHSSGESTSFLTSPQTDGGTAVVRVGSGNGQFFLENPGNTNLGNFTNLRMTASSSSSITRFEIGQYSNPTDKFYVAFKINLKQGTSGEHEFIIGSGGSFGSNISARSNAFSVLTWIFSATGIETERRTTSGSASTTGIGSVFDKNTIYRVEIYGNNSAVSETYFRDGEDFTVNANEWSLWVNDNKINDFDGQLDNLVTGDVIDSFRFQSRNSTNNEAEIEIDDIVYSNSLPDIRRIDNFANYSTDGEWRMLSLPYEATIEQLARQNLVQGITGSFPGAGANIFTSQNGTGETGAQDSDWTAPTGLSETIARGQGFIWLLFDNALIPESKPLPLDLTIASGTNNSTDLNVALTSGNDGWNLLGNPFSEDLLVDDISSWTLASGSLTSSVAQVYNPETNSYELLNQTGDEVASFQGFFLQNNDASEITIPASAQSSGATFYKDKDRRGLISLKIQSYENSSDLEFTDTALELFFSDRAEHGWDLWDASKLTPLSNQYIGMAFRGKRNNSEVLKAQESRPYSMREPITIPAEFFSAGLEGSAEIYITEAINMPEGWSVEIEDTFSGKRKLVDEKTPFKFDFTATMAAKQAVDGMKSLPVIQSAEVSTESPRFLVHVNTATDESSTLPSNFTLNQNYPNPFNPTTVISYDLPENSQVNLAVYDMMGRRVATLVNENVAAGTHQVQFDASSLSSGTYMYRLQAGGNIQTKKLTLIK